MSDEKKGELDWCRVTTRDWAGKETFKHGLIGFADADAPLATCLNEVAAPEIVRRWNAHEALLAAAESALEDLQDFSGDEDYWARVATLRAAIAKARGGK